MLKIKNYGFTIIEVVLVLGVAGLIFIVVFSALPSMQVSSRDTGRREDIITLVSELKNYQTNNRGALPTDILSPTTVVTVDGNKIERGGYGSVGSDNNKLTWAGFYRDYLGEKFRDPDGYNYDLVVVKCGSTTDECISTASSGVANLSDKTFPNGHKIVIVTGATCNGDTAFGTSSPRKIAVLYKLEGAGVFCNNS